MADAAVKLRFRQSHKVTYSTRQIRAV